MSSQPLQSRLGSWKIGRKLIKSAAGAESERRLTLQISAVSLMVAAAVICCLLALTELTQQADAVSINIWKHRYPFASGNGWFYPGWGSYGGHGGLGGFGGFSLGGISLGGYGRR